MKNLEGEVNSFKARMGTLKNVSYLLEDPVKARKLDQILEHVQVDDLLQAVELFKETAE